MSKLFSLLRQLDWMLIVAIFALVAIGLSAIYSVDISTEATQYIFLKKQLIAFFLGAVFFFVVGISNYRLLKGYSLILYIASIASLALVLFLGTTIRGTTGWFSLGAFNFQPVEFAKISLAIMLAWYFSERARKDFGLRELFESAIITAVPVVLTLMQPDLGSAVILMSIWGIVVLFAGIKWKYILTLLVGSGLVSIFSWVFLFAEYQKARLTTFLNPELDPLGQGYNITQALIAIGSGKFFGRGLGLGSQSQLQFLPEAQTDFIFAVIAEELGLFGVVILLSAFFLLFMRILRHASQTTDAFTSYLLLGIGGVFFVHFVINIGMNLGLMPVTGIALPFVSYGGSSLMLSMLMLGVIQSAAARMRSRSSYY